VAGAGLAHTRLAGTRSGHGGNRQGAEGGVVQARQPENIEGRWVLAAALEQV